MSTFADRVIQFNRQLEFHGQLPDGIGILNPFRDNPNVLEISAAFYKKYYNDDRKRHLILGINPGRFGAGLTGIPFTDPKRLDEKCHIPFSGEKAHEPSSVFVYEVIDAYGGPEVFYQNFYINSVCPLGFVRKTERGEVNYNYYDSKELTAAARPFILESIRKHIALGVYTDVCFCLGTGQNYRFLDKINQEFGFFGRIKPLDHPRFVMQYKAKSKAEYISRYLNAFLS
ncbi:MAG: DUF4918 family protein [Saprospiraceae bacterium]|nr:DUF4918 family protein [Saprospiraceae bacterium]